MLDFKKINAETVNAVHFGSAGATGTMTEALAAAAAGKLRRMGFYGSDYTAITDCIQCAQHAAETMGHGEDFYIIIEVAGEFYDYDKIDLT